MNQNRWIAHIVLEAKTPLKVGGNSSDFWQDSPVQRDWNGLPMISGTSIAGVLRHAFEGNASTIFGDEPKKGDSSDSAEGSKVILSNALLCIDKTNKVCEELLLEKSDFLKYFDNLPIREHTAINDKGATKNGAKFDEEVVFKGSRFKFSIEYVEENEEVLNKLLEIIQKSSFRLGGGSSKGFGKLEVIEIKKAKVTLEEYSSSLNCEIKAFGAIKVKNIQDANYHTYTLKIKPDDFFMFGSGFGDSDADMTPVYEHMIDYEGETLSSKMILIPASSIKGALAHRTTYHYNLQNKLYIGNSEAQESIKAIFGEAKNSKENIDGSKGKILIFDCFKADHKSTKTFEHVSIDRFTGGAMNGYLFQEKTVANNKEYYDIEILLEKDIKESYTQAFEAALKDICTGMLSLGGATTKGHGIFCGTVTKDEKMIIDGECPDEK